MRLVLATPLPLSVCGLCLWQFVAWWALWVVLAVGSF